MSISYLLRRSGIFLALVRLPFRIMKRIGNKINTWWWKLHVLRLGRNSLVEMGVSIENPRQVAVGENCLICSDATLVSETIDGNLCLEDRVQINRGVKIDHTGGVLIREHSLISEGATIYSHTHGTDPHSIPKGIPKTIEAVNTLSNQPLLISIVTYGEIYDGIIHGRDPKKQDRVFSNFLRGVEVLPITRTIMKRFATIRGNLRQQGLIIGDFDILIAATALQGDHVLVTHNQKHFNRIPSLRLY